MFATSYARAQAAAAKLSAKLSRRWLLSKEEKRRLQSNYAVELSSTPRACGGGSAFRALLDGKSCQEAIRANRGPSLSSGPAPQNDRAERRGTIQGRHATEGDHRGVTGRGAARSSRFRAGNASRATRSFARPANPSELTLLPPSCTLRSGRQNRWRASSRCARQCRRCASHSSSPLTSPPSASLWACSTRRGCLSRHRCPRPAAPGARSRRRSREAAARRSAA